MTMDAEQAEIVYDLRRRFNYDEDDEPVIIVWPDGSFNQLNTWENKYGDICTFFVDWSPGRTTVSLEGRFSKKDLLDIVDLLEARGL